MLTAVIDCALMLVEKPVTRAPMMDARFPRMLMPSAVEGPTASNEPPFIIVTLDELMRALPKPAVVEIQLLSRTVELFGENTNPFLSVLASQ